jgi:hypothetical protein
MENFSQGAEWTTRYKNNLPDSAFLYIEAGGKKDSEGKIKPRSLRHFPYKDADGKVDRAHILNAIARIPQALFLSQAQKDRLQAKARGIYLKFVKYNSKKANSSDLVLKLAAAVNLQPSMPMDNVPTQNPYQWSENKEFKRIINNLDGEHVVCENAKKPENMKKIYGFWLGLIAIRPALDASQQQAALLLYIKSEFC